MQFIRNFRLRLSEIRLHRDTQSENCPFPHNFHTFGARFHSHRPHEYRNNKLSINILNTMAHDWIFLIAKPNSNTNEDIQTYSGSRSRSADRSVMRRKSGNTRPCSPNGTRCSPSSKSTIKRWKSSMRSKPDFSRSAKSKTA